MSMPFDPYFSGKPTSKNKHLDELEKFKALPYWEQHRIVDNLYIKKSNGEPWTDVEQALARYERMHSRAYHYLVRYHEHTKLKLQQISGAPMVVSRCFNTKKK